MNLLAGTLYDPAVAVNKVTTSLLALTALDTTNLRLTFTVPPSGKVRVRMSGTLHGATTMPQILLGVLEGATVKGRIAPMTGGPTNAATTSFVKVEADFIVSGLTTGASLSWDAAYGVETLLASTGLKYGGPNNATGNDAFGGFAFEIWDCCPIYLTTAVPTSSVDAKLDTIDNFVDTEIADIQSRLPAALVSGRIDASVGAMAANVITAAATAADFGTEVGTAVWASTTRLLTAGTNIVLAKGTGVTGFNDLSAAQVNAEADTALADAGVTTTVTGRIDVATSTRLAGASYTAPDNAGIAAIKAKTDSLSFTVAGKLDVNVLVVNGVSVGGAGTEASPWGPA